MKDMAEQTTVTIARCGSYDPDAVRSAVAAVFDCFGGIGKFARPGERILLKPNFVSRPRSSGPACTDPEVILAVARLVREAGAEPTIGDSPAFGSAEGVSKAIGLLQRARNEGIPIRTLRRSVKRTVELNGNRFRLTVSGDALDFDGIVNLPKFKAHGQVTFTFGVKNLFGCVSGKRKPARHFASSGDLAWFANMLVANAKLVAPRFTLVDGVIAVEGNGPARGTPRALGVLVGGLDTVAVDCVCCEVVNYPSLSLCTNQAARRLGYGITDRDSIRLMGEPIENVRIDDFLPAGPAPIFFSLPRLARSCLRSWRTAMAPD